jgi:S-DNA-T family DNA segregation ATPase FtsK/SpoIIIE
MSLSLARLRASRTFHELLGLGLMAAGVVTLGAVLSYSQQDPSWFNTIPGDAPTRNWIGRVGANLSEALLQLCGVAAFAVPLALGAAGWLELRRRALGRHAARLLGYGVLGVSVMALCHLLYDPIGYGGGPVRFAPGGVIGRHAAALLVGLLNRPGALIASALMTVSMIVLVTRFSLVMATDGLARAAARAARRGARVARSWTERRRQQALARQALARRRAVPGPVAAAPDAPPRRGPASPDERPRPSITLPAEPPAAGAPDDRPVIAPPPPPARPRPPRSPAARQAALPLTPGTTAYALPPLALLQEPAPQAVDDRDELVDRAEQLTHKFQEFDLEGHVVAIHPGPVVTTFEFKPEPGVKYSKITGMSDDLCLALKAESVRIDRMPGRSTVGIEVPNRRQETIYPRELIGSERFHGSPSKLTLALGKDIGGDVYTAELNRMPHLLIAGATGAGKSVMLNGIIVSVLYKATPADVRMIMIDTKMIELGIYADIPHLLVPVVTDPRQASTALKWAVREMDLRYRKLAAVGVRNIDQFNKLIDREPGRTVQDETSGAPIVLEHLPYLVIVIDEMADLMIVSPADVEESIMRLAQMARAVGIHLILATQRPSVDVITGTIKANFPARIAFRVSQRVDSRTIIDQNGAEQLLGRGDMLYLPPGSSRLIRLHSGFITEPELNRLTAFLREMARPVYDDTVLREPEEVRPGVDDGERDPMYVEAVRLILQEGLCSITLIQRRLRLGYARAARIVDMMEQQGVVGPADGSKPREILVGPEFLGTLEASRQ